MAIDYFAVFGLGDPSDNTGLAPTFTVFQNPSGGLTTPPAISEIGSTGIYTFSYTPQGPISFVLDGATTGLIANDRYITGSVDVTDFGTFGSTSDAIGDDSTDPTTLFGFVMRIKEWLEGQSTYTKSTGVWLTKESTGATTLASRTITDNGTTVDKV